MDLQIRSFASVLPLFIDRGARYLVVGSTIEAAGMHELAVWNDGRPIDDVAGEVLDHLGWRGSRSAFYVVGRCYRSAHDHD